METPPLVRDVHLKVRDLTAARDYYTRVIGFTAVDTAEGIVSLAPTADETPILTLHDAPDAAPVQPGRGLFHYAVLLPQRPHLGSFIQHYLQQQLPIVGFADHFVSEAFYFQDIENNGVEVYRDLPRDQWRTVDGHVDIGTEQLDLDAVMASVPEGVTWQSMPSGTVMGHVHLHAHSVPETADFYHEIIGLDYVVKFGRVMWFLSKDGYHHHVGVRTGGYNHEEQAGLKWFTLNFKQAEIDAILSRAEQGGLNIEDSDGLPLIYDPSGNGVRMYAVD